MHEGQQPGSGSELETIRRAQLGDALAWETLVRQNVGWILNTCGRWTGSRARAEELTQDIFIRVFQTLHSYQGERAGFRVWLRRVTRNLLIDDYRRNHNERRTLSYDGADEQTQRVIRSAACPGSSPEAGVERQERRAELCRALRLLGPQLREVVVLRDVKGLTYQEIGQQLMVPVGTVKSRVNRGRIELVRLLRQGAVLAHGFDPNASAVA